MNQCNCRPNAGNIFPDGDADVDPFLYSRCCAEAQQLGQQLGHDCCREEFSVIEVTSLVLFLAARASRASRTSLSLSGETWSEQEVR
jgi:hypothetical protein